MTQTTENIVKIEAIFDRDHGTRNEGWYLRTRDAQGVEYDDNSFGESITEDDSDADIASAALMYVMDPDGATDEEIERLQSIIEVKR